MFVSKHFTKVFTIRFLGYFFIQVGLITLLLVIEPVMAEEGKYRMRQLFGRQQVLPRIITSSEQENFNRSTGSVYQPSPEGAGGSRSLSGVLLGGAEVIEPVSTDFGIVIEKIGANAKVIANVDPGDEKAYSKALAEGVAHAQGTVFPGQTGNIYLFSHSTDAPWNIVRYNAIFYLLSKLEVGDRIVMFYKNRRYDYIIFDKTIATPEDTHFLTDTYDQSVLTLQTCDPPGTLINRLIVRAKLAGG
ncbi:MAG: sortase [Armatimonadetes bacterium]|nr:MAG: sortase [Armatimonadota bacterium]